MKRFELLALSLLTATLAACGGMDPDMEMEEETGTSQQAVLNRTVPIMLSPHLDEGGMTGVGTSACSGSETSSWGNASAGGYQYVSCNYWFMSEWGPGFYTDEMGACINGVVVSSSHDSAWSL